MSREIIANKMNSLGLNIDSTTICKVIDKLDSNQITSILGGGMVLYAIYLICNARNNIKIDFLNGIIETHNIASTNNGDNFEWSKHLHSRQIKSHKNLIYMAYILYNLLKGVYGFEVYAIRFIYLARKDMKIWIDYCLQWVYYLTI